MIDLNLRWIKHESYTHTSGNNRPTRHQLYGHLPPITKTIQVRQTRHAGHCWRRKDELISDVLLWTPTYGRAKTGRPARTYIQQLCEDTGCNPEDLPEAMNNRKKWRERVRDIRAGGTTWWWWWWWWYIHTHRKIICKKMITSIFQTTFHCKWNPKPLQHTQTNTHTTYLISKQKKDKAD